MINASVKIVGMTFEGKGKTVKEAFGAVKPTLWRGKAIVSISNGEVEKQKILMPPIVMNLWGPRSPQMKEIAEKHALTLFNEEDFK